MAMAACSRSARREVFSGRARCSSPAISASPRSTRSCRLTAEGGQLRRRQGRQLASGRRPHSPPPTAAKFADVTVGIRPQHASVDMAGVTGAVFVADARVEIFEALGATGVLIAEAGGVSLTALTSPDRHFEPGQPVKLALAIDQFLYFDPEKGEFHGRRQTILACSERRKALLVMSRVHR
jgi:ABC-type sugar transport system ATPase subunit